jgi:hypothetical protein
MNTRFVRSGRAFRLLMLVAVFSALSIRAAHAYIDPGTGSYLLQVVAASLFAAVFAIGAFWRKIRDGIVSVFSRRHKE